MPINTSLTRRQAIMLSGSAAAGLAVAGPPRWARGAPSTGAALLIPKLIEARNGEPVTLSLQKTQHRFGSGRRCRRGGSHRATSGRWCASAAAIPFLSAWKITSTRRRHCIGTGYWCHRTSMAARTIRSIRGRYGRRRSRSSSPRRRLGSIPHPHGNTARQVYLGLAGMMIVSDGADRDRGLPTTYGVDDLPIVLQDKRFGRNGELVYEPDMMDMMHGFRGDTLLVNGAIGPVASVPAGFVRLRLLERRECPQLRPSLRRSAAILRHRRRRRLSCGTGGGEKSGDRARRDDTRSS